jgi:hypothetical protein
MFAMRVALAQARVLVLLGGSRRPSLPHFGDLITRGAVRARKLEKTAVGVDRSFYAGYGSSTPDLVSRKLLILKDSLEKFADKKKGAGEPAPDATFYGKSLP